MEYYVNHRQMQEIDRCSIQEIGIPSIVLMERAALSVADRIREEFLPSQGRILSICAMGNNGADGMAAARILALKGYQTAVLITGNPEKATKEWQIQYQLLKKLGISCEFSGECNRAQADEYIKREKTAVLIDALFGIGLKREITGSYAELISAMNASQLPIVSVDIPSGVDSDTGKIAGIAVKACKTVTFGRKKLGQILYPGAACCGELKVCEIGFAPEAVKKAGFDAFGYEIQDLKKMQKPRPADSHKGTFGKVLIIAGSKTMAGAAVFSAKAAYRMGCGLVRVRTVEENRSCIHQMIPEAVLSLYESEANDMEKLKADCSWADLIVFGPGMGREAHVAVTLEYLLSETDCPLLLDADGLQVLAEHPEWYEKLSKRVIVTPHMGEMAALTGKEIVELRKNPLLAAQNFADSYGCICVLKGARTVVAEPGMPCYLNTSGCSAMATAGSGDVLTGVIAGFLAEGHDFAEAAALGVYVHGLAGEKAAQKLGERAVMASDLTDFLCTIY
ncbi:MAG: NAD(P)H-hydrate dehydratase [Lachnospiraceae bacterium]|nr:NAD(P)H-hydrate dehydratase [Lachnospiraceae bacterium]